MGDAWAMLGRYLGDAWTIIGRCLGDAWAMLGRCMGDAWSKTAIFEFSLHCSVFDHATLSTLSLVLRSLSYIIFYDVASCCFQYSYNELKAVKINTLL
jgi:hypothetical protein